MKHPHCLSALCSFLSGAALVTGCGQKTPAKAEAAAEAPVAVTVQSAAQRPMPRILLLTGDLQGDQEAFVAADATGKVTGAPIERGQAVAAGQVLVHLDDRSAALLAKEAEANLALAQSQFELARTEQGRGQALLAKKAITRAEFDRTQTTYNVGESALAAALARRDSARKNLADTAIKAPFSGVVADRLVQVGEYVRPETRVARLVSIDRLRLSLNVPETAVGQVRQGQAVSFTVGAFPGKTFYGSVRFVGAAVREAGRDMLIEVLVANKGGGLRPGMFASARLDLGEAPAVAVPQAALREDGSTRRVFVVEQGRAVERLVEVGERRDGWVQIQKGIQSGERVISPPTPALKDGAPVRF